MRKNYEKPVVSILSGTSEGIYAASGSSGTLNVVYSGVWDRWASGGKGLAQASWDNINGTITLSVTLNDSIDDAETNDATVQKTISGHTVTFTFASTATNPLTLGFHLNHNTSIDNLKIESFDYSIS